MRSPPFHQVEYDAPLREITPGLPSQANLLLLGYLLRVLEERLIPDGETFDA